MFLVSEPPLEEGERRVVVLRPHRWTLVRAALPLLALALLPLAYSVLDLAVPSLGLATYVPVVLGVLGLAAGVYLLKWLTVNLWGWANEIYVLTDRRVIAQSGLLTVWRRECSLLTINESDYVSRGLMARLLDFGDVEVRTAGEGGDIVLRGVARPRRVQGLISAQSRALRQQTTRRRAAEDPGDIMRRLLEATGAVAASNEARTEPYRPILPRAVRAQQRLNLLPDEAVVEVARQHPLVLLRRLLLPLASVLLVIAATVLYPRLLLPAAVLVVLVLAPWGAWRVLEYLDHEYVLTTERLMELRSSPLLFEMREVLPLTGVQDVVLQIPTLFGRVVGMGDVVVETSGSGERVVLAAVAAPEAFQQQIFEVIDARQRRQREGEDQRLVTTLARWFQEYHKLQQSLTVPGADHQHGGEDQGDDEHLN